MSQWKMDPKEMFSSSALYPSSPERNLKALFVGLHLDAPPVEGPQAVLDLAVVKRNCKTMLDAMQKLKLSFRAHVKTHKTTQVTRLQVGEAPNPVHLIVSTVAEAEHLLPYLEQCLQEDRHVNVLYGVPPSISSISRLLEMRTKLGPDSIIFMIDNQAQLEHLEPWMRDLEGQVLAFVKIDGGYSRAGLSPGSDRLARLLTAISRSPKVKLHGFYCHHGSSYGVSGPEEALDNLKHELTTLVAARSTLEKTVGLPADRLVLSAGATPTATSAQNLLNESGSNLKALFREIQNHSDLELHAGVYPFLDLQQLATHARPTVSSEIPTMNHSDIGFRILAEVLSVYGEREKPEMLVGAGSLALGREPCKSYPGWGVVAPRSWNQGLERKIYDENEKTGWIVGRISQEHGILTWEGPKEELQWFQVGEKLLLWPNHACIAGAGFGWYLIVDSEADQPNQIVDVWCRWRGW